MPLLIALAFLGVSLSTRHVLEGWTLWISLYPSWSLVALAFVDMRHGVMPDAINLPLIPMGLLAVGLLALTAMAQIYKHFSGRDGLGGGDTKLLAATGAWLGWQALPGVLLNASVLALSVGVARSAICRRLKAKDKIAFGPYLAFALWASWLFGPPTIMS